MVLLSWGANTYGQLGHGVKSELCISPVEIKIEESLDPCTITNISGGGGHTLILSKLGQVFACGLNNKGQLGLPMDEEHLTFKEIKSLKPYHIIQISCGWDSSLAVTKDGELFVWGSNAYGQLGLPRKKVPFTAIPLKLAVNNISTVASGLRHSAVVTQDGHVLVCGNGKKGQLGLVDTNGLPVAEMEQLKEVPELADVCSIACGQHHTVAMTDSGRVFVWGDNKHGQLGMDPMLRQSIFTPVEINTFPQILGIGCRLLCGWTHVAILTDDGRIINWGRNTYGQLGCHEYQRLQCWKPQIISNIDYVKELAVGSEHNIAILGTGHIVSWGWNEHGNCGTGTEEDVRVPTFVGRNIKQMAVLIGSGAGHSFALTNT